MTLFGALLRVTRLTAGWVPYRTWLIMLPVVLAPLWLGTWAWATLVAVLSIYGFKEFARAAGLYRERLFMLVVYLAMIAANATAYFERFGLFMVVPMWGVALLTLVPIVRNRTEGMLQGFALSVLGIQLAQTSLRSNEIHHEEPSQARIYSVSRITDERTNRGKYF